MLRNIQTSLAENVHKQNVSGALIRVVSSYLVDDARELDLDWFTSAAVVAVTAAASAPETVVQEYVEFLKQYFGATVSR